jgi:DNA-binding CsgD family transcriptional regulator
MHLDEASLRRLRDLIAAARSHEDRTLVGKELLDLSAALDLPGRLVIDLAGAEYLGQPMVVFQVKRGPSAELSGLTAREGEVAALIAGGLANKQIAGRLGISISTVKDHVHRILAKTGLPSRSAIAAAVIGREA